MATFLYVIEISYVQLSIVFLALVLVKELGGLPEGLNPSALSFFLPLLALPLVLRHKPGPDRKVPGLAALVLGIFVFALAFRLLPHLWHEVPLGYDPGIYKYVLGTYVDSLPTIPEQSLPEWISRLVPQGLPLLGQVLKVIVGVEPEGLIRFGFPVFSALIVLSLFLLVRGTWGKVAALLCTLVFAASYTQYAAFAHLYLKNVIGLILLPLAIYALERKNYPLFALFYTGLGIYHRPTFLLFSLMLVFYFLVTRRRGVLVGSLACAVLVAPFFLVRFDNTLALARELWNAAVSNVSTGGGEGGGAFYGIANYGLLSLAYQPFAMVGAMLLISRRKWNAVLLFFLVAASLVVFQLAFFRRNIIPLDMALIILAGIGLKLTFLDSRRLPRLVGVVAIAVLIVSAGIPTVKHALDVRPLMDREQLNSVEWIAHNTEREATIVVTKDDAPWVLGWSQRGVVAPGQFHWSKHNRTQWLEFLETGDVTKAREFLDVYPRPLYIYYCQRPGNQLQLDKFRNEYFQPVFQGEAVIYSYLAPAE